jgi:hypothetical protein
VTTDGFTAPYVRPAIVDYGTLVQLTADASLFLGQAGTSDLTFSGAVGQPGAPGGGGEGPPATQPFPVVGMGPGEGVGSGDGGLGGGGGDPLGGDPGGGGGAPTGDGGGAGGGSGSGSGGGGAGSGGGGGGGSLPFTGYAVAAVSAVGAGFTAAGAALRRAVRRRR